MLGIGSARVLVGVSGGMDSVVLLHAFTQVRAEDGQPVRLAAAHVNYGLRGEASDADEALVRTICTRWGVPLAVRSVRSSPPSANRQAWARRVRYQWFRALAIEHGFSHVAVAHHRDDQAETILLKLLGGAGPDRLTGMKGMRPLGTADLCRPFLGLSRGELRAYAERHRLEWREDLSNASDAYDRTHVRALLERAGGSASVVRTARLLDRQYTDLIGPQLDAVRQRAVDGDRLLLDPLRDVHLTLCDMVLTAALRDLLRVRPTEARVEQVRRLLDAQKGKHVAIGGGTVWREHDALRFVRRQPRRPQSTTVHPSSRTKWGAFDLSASDPDVSTHYALVRLVDGLDRSRCAVAARNSSLEGGRCAPNYGRSDQTGFGRPNRRPHPHIRARRMAGRLRGRYDCVGAGRPACFGVARRCGCVCGMSDVAGRGGLTRGNAKRAPRPKPRRPLGLSQRTSCGRGGLLRQPSRGASASARRGPSGGDAIRVRCAGSSWSLRAFRASTWRS